MNELGSFITCRRYSGRAMIGSIYGPYFTERPASAHLIEMFAFPHA